MYTQKKSRKTLFGKAISFLIVLCMMVSTILPLTAVTVSAAAPTSYTTITTDSTASVRITSSGSAKYFKFVPTQSGTYKFYSTNYTADPKASLLNATGNTLITDDDSGYDNNFSFTYACTAGTTYYVKAYMWNSSSTGSYTLNVQTVSVDPTPTPGGNAVDINAAGGTNYPLFNSGNTTSSGWGDYCEINPAPNTYTNNGYDLHGHIESASTSRFVLGLSFTINIDILEQAKLQVKAWDVDESRKDCGSGYEYDYIYLVDETDPTATIRLDGHMSGQDDTWNNTEFIIDPSAFQKDHTYHFELQMTCTGSHTCSYYEVIVRTVNLIINGSIEPPIVPTTGIENADLSASISSSGLVSVDLTAKAYAAETYTLEYKAVCAANNAQYGGKEYSVTIPTTSTEFDTTFRLESGAPRGTYEITVFIKNAAGTVIATRTATASYGYSAVSYNSNGGSQNLPTDGTTYSSGDTVTVKFDYVPSMYGYNFLGWSTDRNATEPMYTENGTKTFTIGASDVTLYAVWALDVCEHDYVLESYTNATCCHEGAETYVCSLCGDTYTNTLAKLDHVFVEGSMIQPPTCTEEGLKNYDYCVLPECELEYPAVLIPIPALGHNYVSGVCSRCGEAEPPADVWDGTVDTSWYNSTATEFTIYTAEQLAGLAQLVNNGNTFSGKTVYLGKNIDLDNREWTPIGHEEDFSFSGVFDGNNYIVYNMTITSLSNIAHTGFNAYGIGLFGYSFSSSAVFKNFAILDFTIDLDIVTECRVAVGGVAGWLAGRTENVFAEGNINLRFNSNANFSDGAHNRIGLFAGQGWQGTSNNCYATGSITVANNGNSFVEVGGFMGFNNGSDVSNSYAVADITTNGSNVYVGGFVGINGAGISETFYAAGRFRKCFAAGSLRSDAYGGGFWGNAQNSGSIADCYYSTEVNAANAASSCGTQTSENNFKSQSWIESNLAWDFGTVWEIRAVGDYPVLQGFDYPTPPTPHIHDFEETSRTEPTCTVDGRINYACSCGETKVTIIAAPGHNIETTVELEVTCTTDGLIVDRCINDGCDYEKRTVIHGEHNYAITDRQDAACETPGYVEYTCANCGEKYYEYFDGAHNYVESARVEPQVDMEGSITYTCTACGDSYDIILPALTPVLKNSSVLLIQDSLPWAENVNRTLLETLKDRGVVSSYNIINTSALASFDLTQYGVVFIANDQSTTMYNRLAANTEKLENYVRAGGNLIYGACDEGWGGCGSLTSSLPGGVTTSNYYSVHNYIVNELHPVVTGVYTDNRSLRDELLKGNYCSHTYFDKATLPAGTDIILRDANGNPTLIEYNLGTGTVIASGLTWEYFYVRDHYNMVTNYSKYAYDDLLTYMVYMSNTCEHNYELVETVAPTCEENGYTKYVCTLCSHEYMGDIVPPIDHTPGEWIVDIPASCVYGSQHKECTVCGKILESEVILPVEDHISSEWIVDVAPTATQTGSRHKECTVCGAVLETEVMPILAKLVIENVEAEAGKTVRVTIDIQNNPGIIGALLTIEYDPALTLIGAEAGNAWNSLYFTAPNAFSNPCNFVWDGVSGADHSNGSIIVLTFEIPSGVDVGTIFNISASYTYGNMINENLEAVDLEIENGSITIVNTVGDVNDDGVVDVADVIVLRRYLAGGYEVVIDEFAADMDHDGYITVADVVLLRRFLVG